MKDSTCRQRRQTFTVSHQANLRKKERVRPKPPAIKPEPCRWMQPGKKARQAQQAAIKDEKTKREVSMGFSALPWLLV